MGETEDRIAIKYRSSQSEGCVVALIIFTIFFGFIFGNQYTVPFALGLAAIAAAILHLAKVLQETR